LKPPPVAYAPGSPRRPIFFLLTKKSLPPPPQRFCTLLFRCIHGSLLFADIFCVRKRFLAQHLHLRHFPLTLFLGVDLLLAQRRHLRRRIAAAAASQCYDKNRNCRHPDFSHRKSPQRKWIPAIRTRDRPDRRNSSSIQVHGHAVVSTASVHKLLR